MVANEVELPTGYSLAWSGQYEYMVRAQERLAIVGPVTLAIIALLLYINFRRFPEVAIILGTLPMALIGGLWLLYWLGYELSVAVGVGFIALAGVAVEIGVVMLVYLNQAIRRHMASAESEGRSLTLGDVQQAVIDGALLRVRPIMMTVAAIIGKLVSGVAAGRGLNRLAVGLGMMPRGEVGLIFASIGKSLGVISLQGPHQAQLIESMLLDRLGPEVVVTEDHPHGVQLLQTDAVLPGKGAAQGNGLAEQLLLGLFGPRHLFWYGAVEHDIYMDVTITSMTKCKDDDVQFTGQLFCKINELRYFCFRYHYVF